MEEEMDEMLANILHKHNPSLYSHLALMTVKGVSQEDILNRVSRRAAIGSTTYLMIQGTLTHFHRKMEAKQHG